MAMDENQKRLNHNAAQAKYMRERGNQLRKEKRQIMSDDDKFNERKAQELSRSRKFLREIVPNYTKFYDIKKHKLTDKKAQSLQNAFWRYVDKYATYDDKITILKELDDIIRENNITVMSLDDINDVIETEFYGVTEKMTAEDIKAELNGEYEFIKKQEKFIKEQREKNRKHFDKTGERLYVYKKDLPQYDSEYSRTVRKIYNKYSVQNAIIKVRSYILSSITKSYVDEILLWAENDEDATSPTRLIIFFNEKERLEQLVLSASESDSVDFDKFISDAGISDKSYLKLYEKEKGDTK